MPILEVVLEQTYFGQRTVNRWNYVASGTPAAVSFSFALVSALGAVYDEVAVPPAYPADRLMRVIAAAQSIEVTFNVLRVRDVFSDVDFWEQPFVPGLTGSVAVAGGSPAIALGFTTNRVRADIRRATKRFVGIPGDGLTTGGSLSVGQLTRANALAAEMSAVQTYDDSGNTLTFTPAVCGKQRYNPDTGLPDPAGRAYRYYPTEADQLAETAEGVLWTAYTQARTQTSRQYGRGQ